MKNLLNSSDLAKLYGVRPSAVSNWRKRGTGPTIPPPDFMTHGRPLWLPETLEPVIADRIAELTAILEGKVG